MFANPISGFFVYDVLISAVALIVFICVEGLRMSMRFLWLPVLATCIVGVSLGLPLFLYMRQLRLEKQNT
jgi:hypothetical protein